MATRMTKQKMCPLRNRPCDVYCKWAMHGTLEEGYIRCELLYLINELINAIRGK